MIEILNWGVSSIESIGFTQTMALLAIVCVGYYIYSQLRKKDALVKEILDQQAEQMDATNQSVRDAIHEIKELSVMTIAEVRNTSGKIDGFVTLASTLVKNNREVG